MEGQRLLELALGALAVGQPGVHELLDAPEEQGGHDDRPHRDHPPGSLVAGRVAEAEHHRVADPHERDLERRLRPGEEVRGVERDPDVEHLRRRGPDAGNEGADADHDGADGEERLKAPGRHAPPGEQDEDARRQPRRAGRRLLQALGGGEIARKEDPERPEQGSRGEHSEQRRSHRGALVASLREAQPQRIHALPDRSA